MVEVEDCRVEGVAVMDVVLVLGVVGCVMSCVVVVGVVIACVFAFGVMASDEFGLSALFVVGESCDVMSLLDALSLLDLSAVSEGLVSMASTVSALLLHVGLQLLFVLDIGVL